MSGVILGTSLAASQVFAHGGGLDDRGCHDDSATGQYHCHQGPLDGRTFNSESAAVRALEGETNGEERDAGRAYDRELYGDWTDADGDCRDTRDEVLAAQGRRIEWSADGCEVVGGVWRGPYTGKRFTDPGDLHIDHVVPLKEAHVSGARDWSASRRREFANAPDNLLAVEASTNMSKGSRDPAEWLPDTGRCGYIERWARVKREWGLGMDPQEREAVHALRTRCDE
ncbi:MAG: HNH endonuclease [Halofilum sp. (in: g-proteobacteria)]